MKGIELGFF